MDTKSQILKYWFDLLENFQDITRNFEDVIRLLYWKITGEYGYRFFLTSKGIYHSKEEIWGNFRHDRDYRNIGCIKTKEIKEILDKENPIIVLETVFNNILYVFHSSIVEISNVDKTLINIEVYSSDKKVAEFWNSKLIWEFKLRNSNDYYYAYLDKNGSISTKVLDFDKFETDIEKNYNDDVPIEKIENFMKDNTSGIILLHGKPGTGKTSFIKHLISTKIAKKFIIIPKEILSMAGQQAFIDFFLDQKESIFILEDCEKVLMKREKGASLETILNISDGLLGSTFKTKFICTFNTNLENIDTALLRKGRLKVKYEFKELSLEKTKKHIPEAIKEMTLAEIYNPEDNGAKGIERKKVGF